LEKPRPRVPNIGTLLFFTQSFKSSTLNGIFSGCGMANNEKNGLTHWIDLDALVVFGEVDDAVF
jgi:hypothetical protein